MLRIDIISCQPRMFEGFLRESIVRRAVEKGLCEVNVIDLRDFGEGRYRKIDDKPYGGGPGCLMMCGPWFAAVESVLNSSKEPSVRPRDSLLEGLGTRDKGLGAEAAIFSSPPTRKGRGTTWPPLIPNPQSLVPQEANGLAQPVAPLTDPRPQTLDPQEASGLAQSAAPLTDPKPRVIMTTPGGKRFGQADAEALAREGHLVFLCGHYEGFDERIRTLATDEYSLGDFVMTGGELAAAAMADSIVRLLPGALGGGAEATASESFAHGSARLEAPQYTHPAVFRGMAVPDVLLSGDHAKIEAWRRVAAAQRTAVRVSSKEPQMTSKEQKTLLTNGLLEGLGTRDKGLGAREGVRDWGLGTRGGQVVPRPFCGAQKNRPASAPSPSSLVPSPSRSQWSGLALGSFDDHFMRMALREAEKAAADGEVPAGCVIVEEPESPDAPPSSVRILARAHNQAEGLVDATAHAEILALSAAFQARGNWRLTKTRLYVTKEPCPMCAGAIVLARVPTVVWGANDPKRGGGTVFGVFDHPGVNHHPQVVAGVLEGECRAVLQSFFRARRAASASSSDGQMVESSDGLVDGRAEDSLSQCRKEAEAQSEETG